MKKFIVLFFSFVFILALIIGLLPQLTSKEMLTYQDAATAYAKGKFIAVNGRKVHYIEKGSGPPIILIHGFLYHTVMWEKNLDTLAERYQVYAIDLWGWGYSERLQPSEYSFDMYANQILKFMDALNIQKATLIGQSMGGGISVYLAAHHPERVDRLILIAPAAIPYPASLTAKFYQLPYLGEFLNAIPGNALMANNIKTIWFYDSAKASQEYIDDVLRPASIEGTYTGMMYILRNVIVDPYVEKEVEMLAALDMPTLIIHGREDKAIPFDRSERLNKIWKKSRLVTFEKAGHSPHEEYPEKFNQLALEFLNE